MVAIAATSAFFSVTSLSKQSGAAEDNKFGNGLILGKKSRPATTGMQIKANAEAPIKINGTRANVSEKDHKNSYINQLPDWSMLLAAITTMFLAAEKQWMILDWRSRRPDTILDPFGLGKIVQDGFVFRQNFPIRSYEIGADRMASMEATMNHLQETALNHCKNLGLLGDGFGSTPEMCKRNLIWVVTRMNVLVDRYPTWSNVVEVDTWVSASGKNGMQRDWLIRDTKTGEILTRASSVWVMMNKLTRKLSKVPEEVRKEIEPFFMNSGPVLVEESKRLPKLDDNSADYVSSGLTPKWSDLDVNRHVNNVKYVVWILESVPLQILETHELAAMTLEYRKECGKCDVLQSLTAVSKPVIDNLGKAGEVECQHLLRLQNGTEIMRGRTEWRPKIGNNLADIWQVPADNA